MLHSLDHLHAYTLYNPASEHTVGSVHDVLFDDHAFVVRYLVIDTGNWLSGRRVLIAPEALNGADWPADRLHTSLSEEDIEGSPPLSEDAPVSQEYRRELALYYGWSAYTVYHPVLGGYGPLGAFGPPPVRRPREEREAATATHLAEDGSGTSALRSVREVTGYAIRGVDDSIGHLHDLIVETTSWTIRYLVIDTVNWLPFTKKVMIPATLLRDVSFTEQRILVDLTEQQIKDSPEFDPSEPINTLTELEVLDYHGRAQTA